MSKQAKAVAEPFAYEEYRRDKIKKMIEEGTANRLKLAEAKKKLPKINKELAKRLLAEKKPGEKAAAAAAAASDAAAAVAAAAPAATDESVSNPLGDDRFKALFSNPDFEVCNMRCSKCVVSRNV